MIWYGLFFLENINNNMKKISIRDIVSCLNGELMGSENLEITGFSGLELATEGDLSFLSSRKYETCLETTKALAVLVPRDFNPSARPVGECVKAFVRVDKPSRALNEVIKTFLLMSPFQEAQQIAKSAHVSEDAIIGAGVQIGHHTVVEEGAVIGEQTVIGSNCYIGRNVHIGRKTRIFTNVVLLDETCVGHHVIIQSGSVIGSDGFGYDSGETGHHKVPHIGKVVIEDDVEIGALVAIDRGRLNFTRIGKGTKIDNLVHVAHNVDIGEHSMLLAQSGIAGSASLGRCVIVAGQSGVVGHIHVGDHATIASRSGASKNVAPHQVISGFPGRDHAEQKKATALLHKLPEFFKKIHKMEQDVQNLVNEEK